MKSLYLITPTFFPRRGGQKELVDRLATELGKRYETTVVSPSCGAIRSSSEPIRPYNIILTHPIGLSPIRVVSGQLGLFSDPFSYLRIGISIDSSEGNLSK